MTNNFFKNNYTAVLGFMSGLRPDLDQTWTRMWTVYMGRLYYGQRWQKTVYRKIFFNVLLSMVILCGICTKYTYSTLYKHQNMNSINMKTYMTKGDSTITPCGIVIGCMGLGSSGLWIHTIWNASSSLPSGLRAG